MPETIKRAVTFGVKYRDEEHPKLGRLANPDGYIVVEAQDWEDFYAFLSVVVGQVVREDGTKTPTLEYAFDYDLAEFEAEYGGGPAHHPLGRLAEFSALPQLPKRRVAVKLGNQQPGDVYIDRTEPLGGDEYVRVMR